MAIGMKIECDLKKKDGKEAAMKFGIEFESGMWLLIDDVGIDRSI